MNLLKINLCILYTMNKGKYTGYFYYQDTLMTKLPIFTDDIYKIYDHVSEPVIRAGFKLGFNFKHQIKECEKNIIKYEKKIRHCWKLSHKDFVKIIISYLFLVKVGKIKDDNYILIKNKNKRSLRN